VKKLFVWFVAAYMLACANPQGVFSANLIPDTEAEARAIVAEMEGYSGYLPILARKLANLAIIEKGQHDLTAARQFVRMASEHARMKSDVTVPLPLDIEELASVRKAIGKARRAGAEECAPEEMASAQANFYLLAHEFEEGRGEPTEQADLKAMAQQQAGDAYRLTVRRKCTAKKFLVIAEIPGVKFKLNSADIAAPYRQKLDWAITRLNESRGMKLEIVGHTCSVGSSAYNQWLSEQRAKSVFDYLVAAGVSESRLISRGYGESRPAADNRIRAGRSKNRRVELRILRK